MNIPKIIKNYFVFMLVLGSLAMATTNQGFEDMFSSVFHVDNKVKNSSFTVMAANTFESEIDEKVLKLTTKANNDFIFDLSGSPDKRFAEPSSTDNEMMIFNFKALQESKLYNLRLKLVGTDSSNVGRVNLMDKDKILAVGKRDGEYFDFDGINLPMKAGEEKSIVLKVSLGSALKTSDRFRMDIENPEDIEIKVEGSEYALNEIFPIKGPYLTVSKNREWGPFKSKKDK